MISGFINLNKQAGITSAKAVSKVKRLLIGQNIKTKVGHFGTLDPDGEGVLPIALGYAPRLFSYDLSKKKVYYTEIVFGSETDTLDASGKVLFEGGRLPNKGEIEKTLPLFIGKIKQIPPKYSAKQVDGVRSYKLARQGQNIELKEAEVEVFSIELLKSLHKDTYAFRIVCGSGTYIRSIARDLGYALGTYAYMRYIRREASSLFTLQDAVTIEQLEVDIQKFILPLQVFTNSFIRYDVDERLRDKLYNGVPLQITDAPQGIFSIYCEGKLFGLGEVGESDKLLVKTRLTK